MINMKRRVALASLLVPPLLAVAPFFVDVDAHADYTNADREKQFAHDLDTALINVNDLAIHNGWIVCSMIAAGHPESDAVAAIQHASDEGAKTRPPGSTGIPLAPEQSRLFVVYAVSDLCPGAPSGNAPGAGSWRAV